MSIVNAALPHEGVRIEQEPSDARPASDSSPDVEAAIVLGAVTEVLAFSARLAAAALAHAARTSAVIAGELTRVPVLGPRLAWLDTRWKADRLVVVERMNSFMRAAVSRAVDVVMEEVDLEKVLDRINVDRVIARADLDAAVERIDIIGIAREVIDELDFPEMIRESSGALAAETIEGLRVQGMNADRLVARIVDRMLLRREGRGTPALKQSAGDEGLAAASEGMS